MDKEYLKTALYGYGRCSKDHWQAHFPAAVVAAYYLVQKDIFSDQVVRRITRQIDLLIDTKRELFRPYPSSGTERSPSGLIANALEETIDGFNDLGHNTIHAAYMLKALETLQDHCQTDLAEDMAATIRKYNGGPPGIWLGATAGKSIKDLTVTQLELLKEDSSDEEIARFCLDEVGRYKNVYQHLGSVAHLGHKGTPS